MGQISERLACGPNRSTRKSLGLRSRVCVRKKQYKGPLAVVLCGLWAYDYVRSSHDVAQVPKTRLGAIFVSAGLVEYGPVFLLCVPLGRLSCYD